MAAKKKQPVIIRVHESWGTDYERLNRGIKLWTQYLARHIPEKVAELRREAAAQQVAPGVASLSGPCEVEEASEC